MYTKFSIYYANLLEETGDFRNAVQSLRATLGKLVEYREERMKATLGDDWLTHATVHALCQRHKHAHTTTSAQSAHHCTLAPCPMGRACC